MKPHWEEHKADNRLRADNIVILQFQSYERCLYFEEMSELEGWLNAVRENSRQLIKWKREKEDKKPLELRVR